MGCSRAARWDIRGTEELGTEEDFFEWLAKEARESRKEKGRGRRGEADSSQERRFFVLGMHF